jgi:hypothetical protein
MHHFEINHADPASQWADADAASGQLPQYPPIATEVVAVPRLSPLYQILPLAVAAFSYLRCQEADIETEPGFLSVQSTPWTSDRGSMSFAEVGDGPNREGGISWGCVTTSLLHRRSDMPCRTITLFS